MSKIMRKLCIHSIAFTLLSTSVIGLDLAKPDVTHAASGPGQSSMLNVDYDSLVSQADLYFNRQVSASYLGMPIGNGRVGGLVWTEPTKLKTQVNRVDVFGHNGASSATSLHGDYFGAVGNVSVDFGGTVFPSDNVPQYLSMYNATENIQGTNLTADVLAWSDQDVIAIRVDDTRTTPAPINIDLSMTRSGPLETKNNYSATSVISENNGKIILTQKYEEPTDTNLPVNNFYNMSAAVIDVAGRTATASQLDAKTMRLSIPASTGSFTIFIGSAASMNRADDVTTIATSAVDTAKSAGYTNIYNSHTAWWHDYWSKSFVSFPAVQGMGYDKDYGAHFVNFYYLMASCFRGEYPAKFNGLLFNTDNGKAMWGTEYWIFNDSRAYYGLETGNHSDLLNPFLNMITRNLNKYQTAAQQQWGSQGIYIPETSPFDGPEVLPDNIAASLKNSLLNGLDLSTEVKNFRNKRIAGADSRWSIDGTGGQWKSGWHSHLVYDAADIANMYWDRYLYTMDLDYLSTTAYPVIKGAAEFYRTFPNLKKGPDNKYHIYKTGFAETIWGADDILNDLNYIRGLLPTAITAAQLLNVDSDLIPLWQDIVDNLAPNPLSSDSNSILKRTRADGKPTYALGRSPIIYLLQSAPTVWDEYQVELLDFDQVNLESKASGVNLNAWDLNMNTLETQQAYTDYMNGQIAGLGIRSWSRFMTDAARMGRSDLVKLGLASNLKQWQTFEVTNPNRLPSTNGETQTMSIQEDGVFVEGIQNGLLQSLAKGPGENPVIHAFGAWPADIDAVFQLQAKKGFTVTASQRSQNIEFVEIYSSLGQTADVNNPWGAAQSVDLYRNGAKAETLTGRLLSFQTSVGEDVVIVKSGTTPDQYKRTISYPKPLFLNAVNTKLTVGDSTQLTSIAGADLSGTSMSYTSSSSTVASVDSHGLVTGVSPGTAEITVKAMSGQTTVASGQISVTIKSAMIPQSQMTATATSQETIGDNNAASMAIDGNPQTMWHSKWDKSDVLPQSITLKLGGTNKINKVMVLPRSGGGNGNITAYNIYVSTDGETFTKVASGSWANDDTEKNADFTPVNASYVKLEATAGINGWASAAEINIGLAPITGKLVGITPPAAVTGVENGVAKTASALGLPAKVEMATDAGKVNANVTWNVEASSYDPALKTAQSFTVNGTVALPAGVTNPNNVVLTTSISVTVNSVNAVQMVNDTDSTISYTGSFSYSQNRGKSDYMNDVHQTQGNGDYFQYTFTGTGIDYIGVKNGDIGNQEVYIDGKLMQTVSGTAPSYTAQAVIYSNKSLASGTHTIKVVKRSGYWMVLDALKVYRDSELKTITAPAAITGVANGTAKTAEALGLPATVELVTDTGSMNANVAWNVEASSYDPAVKAEQTFKVDGAVTLPDGVDNPNNVALTTSIQVTVLPVSTQPQSSLTGAHQVATDQTFDITMGLSGVKESVYQQMYAQDLTLHYDPTNLKLDSVTSLKDGFKVIEQKELVPGHIRIVAASVGADQGVQAQGDLLSFTFTAKSAAQVAETTLSVGNVVIANGEGNELQVDGAFHKLQINISIDKSELNAAIAGAQTKHDAAVEGNGHGLYLSGSKAQLQSAIDAARATSIDQIATQQQVDTAKATLDAAIQVFESKKISADVNGKDGITVGDLAIVAAVYGKQEGQPGWNPKADVNHDGKVDIEDLAIIAKAILQ
ncbi:discoidin domain-containing protein [Paenibacillus sp. GCM10027629]|uniref:discoidin domain-containing protein n=1 Tax=Paenibacillus sp. GCM10027629 TaxID=3273414 RepID=UPI003643FBAE